MSDLWDNDACSRSSFCANKISACMNVIRAVKFGTNLYFSAKQTNFVKNSSLSFSFPDWNSSDVSIVRLAGSLVIFSHFFLDLFPIALIWTMNFLHYGPSSSIEAGENIRSPLLKVFYFQAVFDGTLQHWFPFCCSNDGINELFWIQSPTALYWSLILWRVIRWWLNVDSQQTRLFGRHSIDIWLFSWRCLSQGKTSYLVLTLYFWS